MATPIYAIVEKSSRIAWLWTTEPEKVTLPFGGTEDVLVLLQREKYDPAIDGLIKVDEQGRDTPATQEEYEAASYEGRKGVAIRRARNDFVSAVADLQTKAEALRSELTASKAQQDFAGSAANFAVVLRALFGF